MKRQATLWCLAVMMLLISVPRISAFEDIPEEIILYMGEVKPFPVTNLHRVVVGNPLIADVANVDKNEFTLVPKGPGSTTLTLWDTFGEQGFRVKVFSENTRDLKEKVDAIVKAMNLPDVYTQASDENSRVIIAGKVKTPQDRERISTAFDVMKDTLKDKVINLVEVKEEEGVVGIDVQVLELNKDATSTLGFTWPGSLSLTEVGSPALAATGAKWSTLFKVSRGTRSALSLKLDALVQEGKARILSRPRLSCQSGKEAELLVGGEKPNLTTNVIGTAAGTTTTTVEYKEFGIKLKIKPTIVEEGRVKLSVHVEVSDVGDVVLLGPDNAPTAKAFPLNKRNASTELYLDDGQTLSIGGLVKQKTEEDLRKLPWLADLPVLGLFFRQKVTKIGGGAGELGDTELFITITPSILPVEKKRHEPAQNEALSQAQNTPAVVPSVVDPMPSDPLARYTHIVGKRIQESLVYPQAAKQSGFEGTVGLNLRLSYLGKLLDVTVQSSSGYAVLDSEAVNVAKGLGSFPPFPPSIQDQELSIEIPVHFKLE